MESAQQLHLVEGEVAAAKGPRSAGGPCAQSNRAARRQPQLFASEERGVARSSRSSISQQALWEAVSCCCPAVPEREPEELQFGGGPSLRMGMWVNVERARPYSRPSHINPSMISVTGSRLARHYWYRASWKPNSSKGHTAGCGFAWTTCRQPSPTS